jgi:hypothetical protein
MPHWRAAASSAHVLLLLCPAIASAAAGCCGLRGGPLNTAPAAPHLLLDFLEVQHLEVWQFVDGIQPAATVSRSMSAACW